MIRLLNIILLTFLYTGVYGQSDMQYIDGKLIKHRH